MSQEANLDVIDQIDDIIDRIQLLALGVGESTQALILGECEWSALISLGWKESRSGNRLTKTADPFVTLYRGLPLLVVDAKSALGVSIGEPMEDLIKVERGRKWRAGLTPSVPAATPTPDLT